MLLKPFQRQGVDFLKERTRALLADEPGVGKTGQLITAANEIGAQSIGIVVPEIQPRTIPLDTMTGGLYADATWDLGHGVTVIPGLRGDAFRYVGQNRFTFDPRLVVRWNMNDVHTWKAGAGIYHQMVDPQLLNPDLGNPNLPPIRNRPQSPPPNPSPRRPSPRSSPSPPHRRTTLPASG